MTVLISEHRLEDSIRSWPNERFEVSKGDLTMSVDLGFAEKTTKADVLRFRAEISASSKQMEAFRRKIISETSLCEKIGRIRGGSSGLLGFGEVSILANDVSEKKSREAADLCEPETRVQEKIKTFLASEASPDLFLKDILHRGSIFSYIAITDHWLTVFWASMKCGLAPVEVRDEYLSAFSEHLNARFVKALNDDDVLKLAHITPT